MNAAPVLSARDVRVAFDGRPCLEEVTLDLYGHAVHVLLGRSGSGKSTLLRVLAGVLKPDAGDVRLDGRPLAPEPGGAFPAIGYLMQRPERQFFSLSVEEEVAFALERSGCRPAEISSRLDAVLDALGLSARDRARAPWSLSRGRQRLVAIASVLVFAPRVLLLDEPTAGLDRASARALLEVVAASAQGGTAVLIAGHDLPGLAPDADGLSILHMGRRVEVSLEQAGGRAALEAAGFAPPPLWRFLAPRLCGFWPEARWRQPLGRLAQDLAEARERGT